MRKATASFALFLLLASACADKPGPQPAAQPADKGDAPDSTSDETSTSALCAEVYSPETLVNRSFAFDGTVTSIEPRVDPKLEGENESSWVTFDVHEWYIAGSDPTVSIWIDGLNLETSVGTVSAEVGTRLLVSGEPRWGGRPLEDPLAWTCGFTQPWSEPAAEDWKTATS